MGHAGARPPRRGTGLTTGARMRALVVAEPWVSRLLSGAKTWEMRSRPTRVRGLIGLVRKGSGLVVGVATLVDSLPPLGPEPFRSAEPYHRICASESVPAMAGGWVHPWVVRDVAALKAPVPYVHPRGAVTWVVLDAAVAAAVMAQLA